MILETKAASVVFPAATKLLLSAGQLIFAGIFLAIGFQTGHAASRKITNYWEARKLAQMERELIEESEE